MIQVSLNKARRVRELASIPVEHVPLIADRCISGRQVKRVAQNVVFFATAQELVHPLLRVGLVGIGHSRTRIAQTPLRHEGGTPGDPGVSSNDVSNSGTRDEVVVEIARFRDEIAIAAMIVVKLSSKIESAVRSRIV